MKPLLLYLCLTVCIFSLKGQTIMSVVLDDSAKYSFDVNRIQYVNFDENGTSEATKNEYFAKFELGSLISTTGQECETNDHIRTGFIPITTPITVSLTQDGNELYVTIFYYRTDYSFISMATYTDEAAYVRIVGRSSYLDNVSLIINGHKYTENEYNKPCEEYDYKQQIRNIASWVRKYDDKSHAEDLLEEIVFGEIIKEDLNIDGYKCDLPLAISIGDDDAIEGWLNPYGVWKGGFWTRLYPICASLGIPAYQSTEAWRIGALDSIDGMSAISNSVGKRKDKVKKVLQALTSDAGWEIANHTFTARFNWEIKIDSWEEVNNIKLVNGYQSSNSGTIVFIDGKHYYYYKNQWNEVHPLFYRPRLKDSAGNWIGDNPDYDMETQVKSANDYLEKELNTKVRLFVAPSNGGRPSIYKYANTIGLEYSMKSFKTTLTKGIVNGTPMNSIVYRTGIDIEEAEDSTDNNADEAYFNQLLSHYYKMKNLYSKALILNYHFYRECWNNSIESQLESQGGSYPDSWVIPVRDPEEYPDDFMSPHPSTGLKSWSEWHPCPGTRLYQLWSFLKYCKEELDVPILKASENLDRIKNVVSIGYNDPTYETILYEGDFNWYVEGKNGSVVSRLKEK